MNRIPKTGFAIPMPAIWVEIMVLSAKVAKDITTEMLSTKGAAGKNVDKSHNLEIE